MMSSMSKALVRLVAVVAALGLPATVCAAGGTFEKSIAVDGNAAVYVTNESGAVTVTGADVDEVTILARVRIDKRCSTSATSMPSKSSHWLLVSAPENCFDSRSPLRA